MRTKEANINTLNVINNDFKSLLPIDIPTNLIDKFLIKKKRFEMAKKLKKDVRFLDL
jgi:hypothetical protein